MLPQILCDANVLASAFLEEKHTADAKEFLNLNRKKHRIVVTNDVLGEAISVLFRKSERLDLFEASLQELCFHLGSLTIVDFPQNEEFREILAVLCNSNKLRAGSTDRFNVAFSVYAGYQFFTFDKKLIEDERTINSLLSGKGKFKIYGSAGYI